MICKSIMNWNQKLMKMHKKLKQKLSQAESS